MDDNVQTDSVSEGTELNAEVKPQVEEKPVSKQPLPEDDIEQRIQKAVAAELDKARREIQSAKDKSRAEVESASRRAVAAEQTLSQLKSSLKDADPDTMKDFELAELRAKVKAAQDSERENQARLQEAEFDQKFRANVREHVEGLGINPSDKRIDWADDAENYLEKRARIDKSIHTIIRENALKERDELSKKLDEKEAKIRKELGLDSVDTSSPVASHTDVKTARGKIAKGWEELHKIK